MTIDEAAKILELPTDATPEQLETRFNELRTRLEDKLAKAPTPGLKDKYRRSLEDITKAFETLVVAADASTLPVLQRAETERPAPAAAKGGSPVQTPGEPAAPAPARPTPTAARKKGGSKEFLLVAVIAVVVLGGGGWWVMKTRAEHAERVRLEAEAKARQLAAEKAEAERITKLSTQLGTQLAEARVDWEAYESDLRDAERRTSELKSELRSLRDAPDVKKAELSAAAATQEIYTDWFKAYLARHPAKVARVRAEQLLEARAVDEAKTACEEVAAALAQAAEDIAYRRNYLFKTTGAVRIESEPEGVRWVLTDAYGRSQEGTTPAVVEGLPLTHAVREGLPLRGSDTPREKLGEFSTGVVSVRFQRPGWPDVTRETSLDSDNTELLDIAYTEGALQIDSLPAGVPWKATNALGWKAEGVTPATVEAVPPGPVAVKLVRSGYADVGGQVAVTEGETAAIKLDQRAQQLRIAVAEAEAEIWVAGRLEGRKDVTITDRPPGDYPVELRLKGFKAYKTKLPLKQEATTATHSFSFKELIAQAITCGSCKGSGHFAQAERCNNCGGHGRVRCDLCNGGGTVETFASAFVKGFDPNQPTDHLRANCSRCGGSGRMSCPVSQCDSGTYRWNVGCTTCGADGKLSKLDLSP